MSEDWRVEVELDDEQHGYSVSERLRSRELDEDAKKRLGEAAVVTRDGSKLFVYTNTQADAAEAARVVQELIAAEDLSAELRTTRWHPEEEAWVDVSVPMPASAADLEREHELRDERERSEVAAGGEYDWRVNVHVSSRGEAEKLERRLRDEGLAVDRRWRYVTVGAITQEDAEELASRIQAEVPDAEVEFVPGELQSPSFVLFRSWF